MDITSRDVIYTGIGLFAIAMGSVAIYESQRLEGQIAGLESLVQVQRIELTAQDMDNLRLDNEVRGNMGMDEINFGIAGFNCERR